MSDDSNERVLGKLEAGLDRVEKQVNSLQNNLLDIAKAQSAMTQEMLHLRGLRTEDKSRNMSVINNVLTVIGLVISALALILVSTK